MCIRDRTLPEHYAQARVVLRWVAGGEHQHHITRVGIFTLELPAAQGIRQRGAGHAKGRSEMCIRDRCCDSAHKTLPVVTEMCIRDRPYAERRASTLGPLFLGCGIHMALRHPLKRENRKNTRK